MTRVTKTSRKRTATRGARAATTPARAEEERGADEGAEQYAGAFARVKLVRAWVAVTAAVVAMLFAYVALLERVVKWWTSCTSRFAGWGPAKTRGIYRATLQLAACEVGRRRRYAARAALFGIGLLATAAARPLHTGGGRAPGTPTPTPPRVSYVTITHSGNGTASVYTNNTASTTFTVRNDGAPLTALFSASICTGNITGCSVSPTGTYLTTGASATVTVSFSGGTSAGSGQLRLTARDASDNSVMNYYDVGVTVSVDPNAPTVDLSPHLGDRRDVSQCIADCFESTLSFDLPAYISLDVPRSVTLLYRSGSASPYGKLTLDASSSTAPAGSTFRLQLVDQNGAYVTFTNGTQALYFARNTTGPTRIVAQFKADSIPTSARLYTARVSTITSAGSVFGIWVTPVRIVVINDRNSPYGAGVSLVGVQRISLNQPDGALVTDGTGSATFFAGSCSVNTTCTYTSPSGDFSTLSTGSGYYYRDYPDGTHLKFGSGGHHSGTWDRFGNATLIGYAWNAPYSDSVPTTITDPTGQSISLGYRDANWLYGWKNGSLGNIHTPAGDAPIAIDASNDARQWVELGGGTYRWRMAYLGQHLLDTAYDKAGSVYTHSYRYSATLSHTDAPAVTLDNGTTARPRVTIRNAADTLLERAAAGGGTSVAPLPVATDLRARIIDPVGNVTLYSLSRFGSPTKTKAPLIPADSNEYDQSTGQLMRSISPTGHEVVRTYDSSHRLKTVNDVTLGTADTIVYENQYWLPQMVYGSSGATWFTYYTTKTGWPLKTTSPVSGSALTTHYPDSFGRDSVIADPLGHLTKFAYETTGLRNRASVQMPKGQVTTFTHDGSGRVNGATNPYGNGVTQRTEYDVLNRPTWTASSAYADTTRFYYSMLGQDSATVDAKGQGYYSYRNALGWVTRRNVPGTGTDSVFYDIAGRPVRTSSRGSRVVTFTYDSLSRLVKRTGVATQSVDSMWYDPDGKWIAAQSRIAGSVISTDTLFTDEPNHITKVMTNRPTIGAWRVQSTFNWDDPGRSAVALYKRVNNADSTAAFTNYFYSDAQKRLTDMASTSDTAKFFYNAESLVDSVTLRAGLTEKFTHTPRHELSTRGYAGASWVDDSLRRWYYTDSLARTIERGGPDSLFQAFGYDSIGRLRSWQKKAERSGVQCVNDTTAYGYTCTGASPWILGAAVTPTYDKVGNPTDLGAATTSGNRLTSFNGVTMTYDADGNMRTRVTATTTDTLTWDEFGRLVSFKRVPQGQSAVVTTFSYDGLGRRVKKTSTSGTVEYLWDGDQIIAEVKGTGASTVVRTYTYYPGVDQPRSVAAQGETYFTSAEPDGSVYGLIRKSDRTVVAQYKYTPWGEIESAGQALDTVSSLRWKGLPYDAETGLYYMRARYYDPVVRRFVGEDPAGLSGGLNLYTFAGNDPVNSSDPSGLKTARDRGICSIYSYPCRGSDALEDWMMSMHGSYDDDIDEYCFVGGNVGRYMNCLQQAAKILGTGVEGYAGLTFLPLAGSVSGARMTTVPKVSWVFIAPWLKGCPNPASGAVLIQPLAWKLPTDVIFEAVRKTEIMKGQRQGGFLGPETYEFASYTGKAYSSSYPEGKAFKGLAFCEVGKGMFTEQ